MPLISIIPFFNTCYNSNKEIITIQTVPQQFIDMARGDVRSHSWGCRISFTKAYDDSITFFTLNQSLLNGGDILSTSSDSPLNAWDYYEYADYTDRITYMSWDRSLEFPYSIASARADFQLANTDKYFTPNSTSPIKDYILPKRPVRLLSGFRNMIIPQFVGLTQGMPSVNDRDGTATFTALDFLTQIYEMPIRNTIAMASGTGQDTINLIVNPSFEQDATGWTGSNMSVTSDDSFSGSKSLFISNPGSLAQANNTSLTGANLEADAVYTLSFYLRRQTAGATTLLVRFSNGPTTIISLSESNIPNTGVWTRYSATFTATEDPLSAELIASTVDDSVSIDAIMLTQGPVLYDYFDGNSQGDKLVKYSWLGSPNVSQSRLYSPKLTTDRVLAQIFSDFGLTPNQYNLAKGRNAIPFLFFEREQQTAGDVIRKLMEAEGGMLWLGEDGVIRFRPRLEQPTIPVYELNDTEIVDIEVAEDTQIINQVVFSGELRTLAGYQNVYSKTQSSTANVIMANSTGIFSADLKDPCLDVVQPIAGEQAGVSWFNASLPNGTIVGGVTVQSVELKTNSYDIVFNNSNNFDVNISELELFGDPAKVYGRIDDKVVEYQPSIDKYEVNPIFINNNFIQTESQMESLGLVILDDYAEYASILNAEIKGNPALSLGDVVTVNYKQYTGNYRIIGISSSLQQGRATQNLKLRSYEARDYFVLNVSQLNSSAQLAP